MSRLTRPVGTVHHLPTVAFGARDIMAWGTGAFMLIEGFTLVVCATVLVYLRKNYSMWPPEGTLRPDWVVPTVHAVFLLVTLPLVRRIDKHAHEWDLRRVRNGLTLLAAICLVSAGFRAWELLRALNVKWSENAYGSAQWLVVGSHATLIAVELVELVGMALIFWLGPVERKHFSDAADIAIYWLFLVLSWIPLYVLSFLLPQWI
jgi:cytochrome c oxidase subunit III